MACPTDNSFPSLIKHAIDNMLLFSTHNITASEMDTDDEHETTKESTKRLEREVTVAGHETDLNSTNSDDTTSNMATQSDISTVQEDLIKNSTEEQQTDALPVGQNSDIVDTTLSSLFGNVREEIASSTSSTTTSTTTVNPDIFLCKK